MNDDTATKIDAFLRGRCQDPVGKKIPATYSFSAGGNPMPALVKSSSSSPSDAESSGRPSFKPYKILYPMKCASQQDALEFLPDALGFDGGKVGPVREGLPCRESREEVSLRSLHEDDNPVKWVGLTPLDMVQHISLLAGKMSPECSPELWLSALRKLLTAQVGERKIDDEFVDDLAEVLIASHRSTEKELAEGSMVFMDGKEEEARLKNKSSRLSKAKAFLAMERQATHEGITGGALRPNCHPIGRVKDKRSVFQSTMAAWLKHNFANPFPDDDMLMSLATYMVVELPCVTITKDEATLLEGNSPSEYRQKMIDLACEKITNWLVNSRTRKWRPSIEGAFDAKRPVASLLEDSVRLYEGKKLRPIKNWDGQTLFASDPVYSTSLRSWKKSSHARGKKRKTSDHSSDNTKKTKQQQQQQQQQQPKPDGATSSPPFGLSPMGGRLDKLVEAAESAELLPLVFGGTSPALPSLFNFSPMGGQMDKLVEAAEIRADGNEKKTPKPSSQSICLCGETSPPPYNFSPMNVELDKLAEVVGSATHFGAV